MTATFSPFLDTVSKITAINLTETIFPIAKLNCKFTPMVTGDDVTLRTSLVSPTSYDRELCKLIIKHLTIVGENEDHSLSFTDLTTNISNIDKLSAIWALYKATYETLADNREIKCPKKECNSTFEKSILMDDLIHEDTYMFWDKIDAEGNEIPFTQYKEIISVETKDKIFDFNVKIPSIKDNNDLLATLSIDAIQYNLDNIKSIFNKPQHMVLLTDAIRISSKDNSFESIESNKFDEMMLTFTNYLPFQVSDKFFKKYDEIFGKYSPDFYVDMTCPNCGHTFKYYVDLETEFFRKCLSV